MAELARLVENPWRDKAILVTGAAGTIGREIMAQLVTHDPRAVIGMDNNESAVFYLEHEFDAYENVSLALVDIADLSSLTTMMEAVDVVIHTAALKHVGLCERTPRAAIQTNILGTQNVIQAALAAGVERVLFTSSDKGVNPTNVMGTSKLMAERLMTAANAQSRSGRTIFASSRFGNVLGSRGSVIPLFKQQIAAGGPLTLTDPEMTRFIMTLSEAVALVTEAMFLAKGGEVFVTKMPVCRIEDLALIMIEELAPRFGHDPEAIRIRVTGARPGEKLYEELTNEEEIRRTIELENHLVIVPALQSCHRRIDYSYPLMRNRRPLSAYNSSKTEPMSREQLRHYLRVNDFLNG
ncbi:MAG TPA: SDR family NAD(P)-dependent oxidoreductase [Geminicoccaceae bacterium]